MFQQTLWINKHIQSDNPFVHVGMQRLCLDWIGSRQMRLGHKEWKFLIGGQIEIQMSFFSFSPFLRFSHLHWLTGLCFMQKQNKNIK